jgi:multisubunit Na+/H+ antiporter MnhC subunit
MTNEGRQPRRILRRIGAVLAGMIVIVILDLGIDLILHGIGVYPPWFQPMRAGLWLLAIGYRSVDGIIGGYTAASIAPDRPLAHALVLGGIGIVLSTLGLIATVNKGPEFGPKWYPLALVGIALPCSLIGGLLRRRQLAQLKA